MSVCTTNTVVRVLSLVFMVLLVVVAPGALTFITWGFDLDM
jgi:hypothetical protein